MLPHSSEAGRSVHNGDSIPDIRGGKHECYCINQEVWRKLQNFCNFEALKWLKIDPKCMKKCYQSILYIAFLKKLFFQQGPVPPLTLCSNRVNLQFQVEYIFLHFIKEL